MRKINIFIILFLTTINIYSADWEAMVPNLSNSDRETLESGTFIVRSGFDYKDGLELLPKGSDFDDEFITDIKSYNPELSVEMLYLFDKPEGEFRSSDELILYLYNNLVAFSDQEGVEYFSNRKQAMSLLIEECYFTTENGKKKLDDPFIKSIVPEIESFYYQDDTTFGGNRYKLTSRLSSNSIWLQMENLGKLSVYKFFKALNPGGQRTNFMVHPAGDKILVYAIAQIKHEPSIKRILTYEVNIPYSFQRRMNSIVTWYKDRL